jgi:hypothetical protein
MPAFIRLLLPVLCFALLAESPVAAQDLSAKEKERRARNAKFDVLRLREKTGFVTETSPAFLREPSTKPKGEYLVAKVPPTVRMRILPHLSPEYFPEGLQYSVGWASWCHLTRAENNTFYFAASDHCGIGGHINLYEYCPARNDLLHRVLDVSALLGWTPESYTDGKIHGEMGIMPDGTLWAATHYGPEPDSTWYANGYRGSWLLSYNIHTREAKNWGVPLPGNSLPCFAVDTRRGILLGTGEFHQVLCWDCVNRRVRYAGFPPHGWIWWRRTMLVDEDTGKFWSVCVRDIDDRFSEGNVRFMSFDPELNRFELYDVTPPPNPFNGKVGVTRGYTSRPAPGGWYYMTSLHWQSGKAALFRFKPEGPAGKPVVEPLGVTWDEGVDVQQMALDPTGRYVYYYAGPVIQYDTKTGKRKVLCWLKDYFQEKYGYALDFTFGFEISTDGTFLVMVMNGEFSADGSTGHPSLFVIGIPSEERTPE